jgi:tetratricopeptide (TPR) repeat protein
VTEAVSEAWEALARGAWSEALALLETPDEDPEALECVGLAYWWLDNADATIDARERAYRLYRERGDVLGAARVAEALAWDSVLFGGRIAVARGWLDRAAGLLVETELAPEHAWLAVREAEVALAAGEPTAAKEAAAGAVATATELNDEEVQVVGRSLEGLALVHEGAIEEGMRRLDSSAVAARAGDVKDLMWVGKVCCNLITACERVGDVERATEWCAEVKEFAQRWELQTLFNVCRTQYAAVLLQTGAWSDAEAELQAALAVFDGGRRSPLFEGSARLGELRRRQGRLEEARALFAAAERSSVSRLGTVELALDEDDP